MEKKEFKPKYELKIRIGFIMILLFSILLLWVGIFLLSETYEIIIAVLIAIFLIAIIILNFVNVIYKKIILSDVIILERYLFKNKRIKYDDVDDVSLLFIKYGKREISLINIKNSMELVEMLQEKINEGLINLKENYQIKLMKSESYTAIASFISFIITIIITAIIYFFPELTYFLPINVTESNLTLVFVLIQIVTLGITYLIVKKYYSSKESPATALLEQGDMFIRSKQYEKAIEAFDKAIELDSSYEFTYHGKGVVLIAIDKNEEAISCFDKAIELEPKFSDAYLYKGIALYNLNILEDALECYDKAIGLDAKDYSYHFYKGLVLEKMEKLDDALKSYNKSVKLQSKFVLGYYRKSCIYVKMGKNNEAIKMLKKAIKINPKIKDEARKDSDFNSIRSDLTFRNIIE